MPIHMQPGFDSKAWLDGFFERHADKVTVTRVEPWQGGQWRYVLERCAFDEGHANSATAAVVIRHSGGYGYVCQHQSCASNHWQQFRALFEAPSQPPPLATAARGPDLTQSPPARSEWTAPDLLTAD